jgi:hypothetical protein
LVSGGILAFSISFIKDIIKIVQAEYFALLFIGWGLIIVSIGIMMYAFLKSANASDQLWKLTDDFIIDNTLYDDDDILTKSQVSEIKGKTNSFLNDSKDTLKNLRKWAVISFLAGIFSFSFFVCINLIVEKNLSYGKNESTIKKIFPNDTLILKNQKQ